MLTYSQTLIYLNPLIFIKQIVALLIQTMYMSKTLAGVRVSTTNNLVLAELGLPSLETRVKKAQKLFMKKMVQTRVGLTDDPFMHIW